MHISLTPLLLAIELGFLFMVARHSSRFGPALGNMVPMYLYLLWVTSYGIVTSILGANEVFISEELLILLPGFWLQLITVAVCVLPVILFGSVRGKMRQIVDITPYHWFAYFHGLRILALGTTYKTIIGEFPVYFEILVGIPDLLFGISALWIAKKAQRGEISEKKFMIWNLIGALIIVPSAPILLQLGLPGPVQIFKSLPDARAVFTYPMSIAPMIGVPLFVLINVLVAWRLWERSKLSERIRSATYNSRILD